MKSFGVGGGVSRFAAADAPRPPADADSPRRDAQKRAENAAAAKISAAEIDFSRNLC